jgi:ferredoxin
MLLVRVEDMGDIQSAAQISSWLATGRVLFLTIHLLGVAGFAYIVARRLRPLFRGERDFRFDRPWLRLAKVLKFWLGQWKHPRYKLAGTLHIFIFAGFILLAIRAFTVLIVGVSENFVMPGFSGRVGPLYGAVTDYAATIVFVCMVILTSSTSCSATGPFGIQFHVETSLFNVYFAKLDRGTVKPVRWGVATSQLDQVKSFGVKTFEDFTWKHMLDFYSCADCGRCSDKCPANAVGRPLSPRFLTIKARDYAFQHSPVWASRTTAMPLIGGIYSEDEIWSCTTCGACEEECPLLIEYIDKIVDCGAAWSTTARCPSPCKSR